MTWDLIVVGAGIIGLSAAFEAASTGMKVLVVDKAVPATGASGVAAGMLAPLAEAHDMPDDLVRIGIESGRLYRDLVERVEAHGGRCAFRDEGTLIVAADRDQAGDLAQLQRAHERMGLEVERLSVRDVLRREPRVSPRIAGGLSCPEDHSIDPVVFCRAIAHALGAMGSAVRTGVEVHEVVHDHAVRGVRVTEDGAEVLLPAKRVLLAAGLDNQALAEPFGDLGLRPVKGQVLHLRGESLLNGVVRTPRVYLVPRGEVLVVGASEEEMGRHAEPLAGVTMDLLYEAWRTLPGVYELELHRIVVGHRPSSRDGRPTVGPLGPDGLFLAAGHHRHGILLAPWTAKRVVEAMGVG